MSDGVTVTALNHDCCLCSLCHSQRAIMSKHNWRQSFQCSGSNIKFEFMILWLCRKDSDFCWIWLELRLILSSFHCKRIAKRFQKISKDFKKIAKEKASQKIDWPFLRDGHWKDFNALLYQSIELSARMSALMSSLIYPCLLLWSDSQLMMSASVVFDSFI